MGCAALKLREVAEVPYGSDRRGEPDDERMEQLGDEIALAQSNGFKGARPDGWTASAAWERERDIPDDVHFRASESR